MSATASSRAAPMFRPSPDSPTACSLSRSTPSATMMPVNPHHRGGRVLFEIRFASSMRDLDLACLARLLDLSPHMYPKMRPDPNSPGVARLDHHSGLFLERGAGAGQWLLQARTWGTPAPQTVREWQLLAANAARQLDPGVALPGRTAKPQTGLVEQPLERAATKRLARIRHRPAGLP